MDDVWISQVMNRYPIQPTLLVDLVDEVDAVDGGPISALPTSAQQNSIVPSDPDTAASQTHRGRFVRLEQQCRYTSRIPFASDVTQVFFPQARMRAHSGRL